MGASADTGNGYVLGISSQAFKNLCRMVQLLISDMLVNK
jgi:hypothetical protein